jgi:hypothetical protein
MVNRCSEIVRFVLEECESFGLTHWRHLPYEVTILFVMQSTIFTNLFNSKYCSNSKSWFVIVLAAWSDYSTCSTC